MKVLEAKGSKHLKHVAEIRKWDLQTPPPIFPLRHLDSATAELVTEAIYLKIDNTYLNHVLGRQRKLFVVAHSSGTLSLVRALQRGFRKSLQIEGVILLGSIECNGSNIGTDLSQVGY
jgi:alpha-beta hydrolase superfamily lysophospholipase